MNKERITQINKTRRDLQTLIKENAGKKIRITQIRGTVRTLPVHRANITALGLHGIGKSVEHVLTPQIAGMMKPVCHLIKFEVI